MTVTNADILNASILIVDDQLANVQLLEQMLRGAGYQRITSTQDPRCRLRPASRPPLRPDSARSADARHGRLSGDGRSEGA